MTFQQLNSLRILDTQFFDFSKSGSLKNEQIGYIQLGFNTNSKFVTSWLGIERSRGRPRHPSMLEGRKSGLNLGKRYIRGECGRGSMTVKSVRGRRRYTAFEVPLGTDRHDAESAVSAVGSAKVITCGKGYAVVRSLPSDREHLEKAMSDGIPGSSSFDCSGTLRALRTRHPQLNAPRKRRRRCCTNGQTLYTAPPFESR